MDFFESPAPGSLFISNIVMSKPLLSFRRELVLRVHNDYPDINIVEHFNRIIRLISCSKLNNSQNSLNNSSQSKNIFTNNKFSINNMNFNSVSNIEVVLKICKLCLVHVHSLVKCPTYDTDKKRLNRYIELKMCTKCTSTRQFNRD